MRKENILKKKLVNGEVVVGTWCIMPSSSAVNVIAASGIDFLIIDMEHGPPEFSLAEDMIRAAESELCSPLIRVPKNDKSNILRAFSMRLTVIHS